MTTPLEILRSHLKHSKKRRTLQREKILTTLLRLKGHLSVEDLHLVIEAEGDTSIGIATVYRAMNLFRELGLVQEHALAGGKKTYEVTYRRNHHDHLVCTRCKKIVEFEHPQIEKLQREVCRIHDFAQTSHHMELVGVCSGCLSRPSPSPYRASTTVSL